MSKHCRVTLATLLIISGVLVFLPSSYVSAGGAVVNSGFENGEEQVPSGWNLTGNAMRVDTGPIYGGDWSAQVTGDGDTFTQWVSNITGGMTYEAWGWIYVSGDVTGVMALDFWLWDGQSGSQLSPTIMLTTTNTSGSYVQKTGTIQAPSKTTHIRIRLYGTSWHEGAEVRFDEIGLWVSAGGLCFIATAAYGTETASQLVILRDFRDQVLLKNALGSRFVAAYYKISPPIANFIAKHDFLRAIVREMLIDPVVNLLQRSQGHWRT